MSSATLVFFHPSDLIFYSAGFDASEHEHPYMSRHRRRVPTAFYTKFAKDVSLFAEQHAFGKVVSVLEGGYSDWALMSGSGALISGLVAPYSAEQIISKQWWDPEHLAFVGGLVICTRESRSH
jgi:histone deacetylase HOS3